MKIIRKANIDAPASMVWDLLYTYFDRADAWMSAVRSSLEITGADSTGRICQLTSSEEGLASVDVIDQVDEEQGIFSFDATPFNAPALFPILESKITIRVKPISATSCQVTYMSRSVLTASGGFISPLIRLKMQSNIDQILQDLKKFTEKRIAA